MRPIVLPSTQAVTGVAPVSWTLLVAELSYALGGVHGTEEEANPFHRYSMVGGTWIGTCGYGLGTEQRRFDEVVGG